jgi:DNA damage-binding protein 1
MSKGGVELMVGFPVHQVNVASASPSQVLVATGEGNLYYFEIGSKDLKEVAHVKQGGEISCLDISPLGARFVSGS